jgi:hypothetical protein
MPRNPSKEARIEWHLAHAGECGCRPVPPDLRKEVAGRKPSDSGGSV